MDISFAFWYNILLFTINWNILCLIPFRTIFKKGIGAKIRGEQTMLPGKVFKLHLTKNVKKSVLDVFRERIHDKFTWWLFWDYLQTGVKSTGVVNDPATQLRNLRYHGNFKHANTIKVIITIVFLRSDRKNEFNHEISLLIHDWKKEPSQKHRTSSEPAQWLCSLAQRRILVIMIIRKLQEPKPKETVFWYTIRDCSVTYHHAKSPAAKHFLLACILRASICSR